MIGAMPRIDSIVYAVCAAAAVGVAGVLGGCARSGGDKAGIMPGDAGAPVVRGTEAGLEVRLWVVENRSGVLGGGLREFDPPTLTAGAIEAWRQNGFRVLEVPIDRLDELRAGLPTIGPIHQEWMGLLPEWVEVVKGTELKGQREVRFENGSGVIGPGRLRLLTRCWAVPVVGALPEGDGAGALLRLEVMPQLGRMQRSDRDALGQWLGTEHESVRTGARGLAFTRLRLGVVSSGGNAIVIVPEDPDYAWDAEADGRPESESEARQRAVVGPRMQTHPTLGELMLTNLALAETPGDARVVVVLVPRVPERFELLPRSR